MQEGVHRERSEAGTTWHREVRLTTQTARIDGRSPPGGGSGYLPSGGPFVSIIPHSLTIIVSPCYTG